MTVISGVDYAWQHPGGAALKAAGKQFVCRYLSGDPSKNIGHAEAVDLAEHGISIVCVWETTARRALAGRSAGESDARQAHSQAVTAGMPADRPIYFAVDWDAQPDQQDEIADYLDGAAAVLGRARVGIYAGYWPLSRALNERSAAWAWQTVAWSGGHWDPRAHIRQAGGVRIAGVSCDLNTARRPDFGQWTPGHGPSTPHASTGAGARTYHVVKSGETLSGIAEHFHVAGGWRQLQQWNHIKNPSLIVPGQKVYLQA